MTTTVKQFIERKTTRIVETNENRARELAKLTLIRWFNGRKSELTQVDFAPFHFKPNRGKLGGIVCNYPVCKISSGIFEGATSWEQNWDELLSSYNDEGEWDDYVPTKEDCIKYHTIDTVIVVDIVATHKGRPKYAIELCYKKNPTSFEKIKELKDIGVTELYEIDIEWVLNQTMAPNKIKCIKLI